MSTSEQVLIKFGANISAIRKANEEIVSGVAGMRNSLSKIGAEIFMIYEGAASAVQTAVGVLQKPFEEFSKTENASVRLAPLVGGLGEAAKLCKDLRRQAAGTNVGFDQLTKYAAKLSSVFKDTATIKTWTAALQNMQIATGEDMNEVLNSVIKAKASGRFEAGILENFASKGINIFPELERQTGLAKAQILELARAGKLSFSEVEKAILGVSTGTGVFAQQAEALRGTFSGALAQILESFNILLGTLVEGPAKILTPIFNGLNKILSACDGFPARAVGVGLFSAALYKIARTSVITTGVIPVLVGIIKVLTGAMTIARFKALHLRKAIAGIVPFGIGIALDLLAEKLFEVFSIGGEPEAAKDLESTNRAAEQLRKESEKLAREQQKNIDKLNKESESANAAATAFKKLADEKRRVSSVTWTDADDARKQIWETNEQIQKENRADELRKQARTVEDKKFAYLFEKGFITSSVQTVSDFYEYVKNIGKLGGSITGEGLQKFKEALRALNDIEKDGEPAKEQPQKQTTPEPPQPLAGDRFTQSQRISTAQASIGGGRSLNLGMSASLRVAQDQLSVLKKIETALKNREAVAVMS